MGNTEAQESLADLLDAAAAGRPDAWNRLVARFTPLLWAIARGYRLSHADAQDIVQITWWRLAQHLTQIKDPQRVAGWLATTTRRECQAVLRRSQRLEPIGDNDYLERLAPNVDEDPAARLLLAERDKQLWQAFAQLSERCQRVLRVLVVGGVTDPPPYREAAELLGMPLGALGPTRGRCLDRLRTFLETSAEEQV